MGSTQIINNYLHSIYIELGIIINLEIKEFFGEMNWSFVTTTAF